MKNLLSLLSIITISGTTIQTTIANSYYQPKINNLESLRRLKRDNNYCRTNCKDYCPETGQCRFDINRFFTNTTIKITRTIYDRRRVTNFVPNNELILQELLLANPEMNHLNRNDLVVVSSTTTSAVIKMANPTYNIYGELTVNLEIN